MPIHRQPGMHAARLAFVQAGHLELDQSREGVLLGQLGHDQVEVVAPTVGTFQAGPQLHLGPQPQPWPVRLDHLAVDRPSRRRRSGPSDSDSISTVAGRAGSSGAA